jgi:hypothetical protein
MIADALLSIIIYFIKVAQMAFPINLVWKFTDFAETLNSMSPVLSSVFGTMSRFVCIDTLFLAVESIIAAEIILLGYHATLWVLKFVRG